MLEIASAGNQFLEERAPWANFKKGGEAAYIAGTVRQSIRFFCDARGLGMCFCTYQKHARFLFCGLQDLVAVLEATRIVAVALSPVVPTVSRRIYLQLGYSDADYDAITWVSSLLRCVWQLCDFGWSLFLLRLCVHSVLRGCLFA